MSVDSLIIFEISLIVFLISQGENKICSIEIRKSSFLVVFQICVFSSCWQKSWISRHSRRRRMRILLTKSFLFHAMINVRFAVCRKLLFMKKKNPQCSRGIVDRIDVWKLGRLLLNCSLVLSVCTL